MRWQEVEVLEYKREQEDRFREVTRRVRFDDPSLASHPRYFEVATGATCSICVAVGTPRT